MRLSATTLLLCSAVLVLMPGCTASTPESAAPTVSRVVLRPIYPPKAGPDAVEVFAAEQLPDRPMSEISPVSTRAWSLEEGVHNLREKAALLGADAVVNLRHKTRFNAEHAQSMYFVYGDAILWKQGRNSEYVVCDEPPPILPVQ